MIPLVCELKELKFVKDVITKTADAIISEAGVDLQYMVGTMIEIPRAALLATRSRQRLSSSPSVPTT